MHPNPSNITDNAMVDANDNFTTDPVSAIVENVEDSCRLDTLMNTDAFYMNFITSKLRDFQGFSDSARNAIVDKILSLYPEFNYTTNLSTLESRERFQRTVVANFLIRDPNAAGAFIDDVKSGLKSSGDLFSIQDIDLSQKISSAFDRMIKECFKKYFFKAIQNDVESLKHIINEFKKLFPSTQIIGTPAGSSLKDLKAQLESMLKSLKGIKEKEGFICVLFYSLDQFFLKSQAFLINVKKINLSDLWNDYNTVVRQNFYNVAGISKFGDAPPPYVPRNKEPTTTYAAPSTLPAYNPQDAHPVYKDPYMRRVMIVAREQEFELQRASKIKKLWNAMKSNPKRIAIIVIIVILIMLVTLLLYFFAFHKK